MPQIFPFTTPEDWLKLRTQDVTSTESAAFARDGYRNFRVNLKGG